MLPTLPITLILRTLPNRVHVEFFSRLCNHLLKGQMLQERLDELEGKVLSLVIADTATELLFAIHGNRLERVKPGSRQWDVRIKGKLEDLWLLATRKEDPDTLFFNRQLTLEGDTATGLLVKNLLDSLEFDWEAHIIAVLGPGPGKHLANMLRSAIGLKQRLSRTH